MLSKKDLTWDIRKQVLGYLMFLKRNQSGKMKARGCTNGRPQQKYITKEEPSSPTVPLYALIGLCLIDAMDKQKAITVNIPGAFLQGNCLQDEHPGYFVFEGIMVDMICEIDPAYNDKIIWSKNRNENSCTVGLSK